MAEQKPIDLTPEQLREVKTLLQRYLANTQAWAYGSRVRWNARPDSDLDLVVFATPEQQASVSELREAFAESNLPFPVDLFVWDQVPKRFRGNILSEYKVLQGEKNQIEKAVRAGWKEHRLGDITDWASGGTPPKSKLEYWGENIPWISASSMDGNRYSDSKLKVTKLGLQSGTKLALKNTILLLVRGSILHQKIRVGIAERDVSFNQDVKAITIKDGVVEPWFLLLWFVAQEEELLNLVENTGIGAGKLDTKILQDMKVMVPPDGERHKILTFAKAVEDKIELNRQINKNLESMAQALFKSWFVDFDPVIDNALAKGNSIPEELQKKAAVRKTIREDATQPKLPEHIQQLFPNEFELSEEIGWIPKGWNATSTADALEINPKLKLAKGSVSKFADMKTLPIRGYSVNGVIEKEFKGGAKFSNGDVLLARITPCLENGKTAIADFLEEGEVGFGSTEFIVLRGCGGFRHTVCSMFISG